MQGPRSITPYLKDGSEEQPQGAGSDSSKDLEITDVPSSSPGCAAMSSSPSHNHPLRRPRKRVTREPHLCPAAFLCVLSVTHAACQQKGQVKSVPRGPAPRQHVPRVLSTGPLGTA